jgi:hypothetical protein
MATKELVFELSEVNDLRLGFVCPKCEFETVCPLSGETPFHRCHKDNNPYPDAKGQQILKAFQVALWNLMELKPAVRLRLTIPQ